MGKSNDGGEMNRIRSIIDGLLTSKIFLIILLLIGLLIFSYPLIADKYYSIKQENTIKEYDTMLANLPTEDGQRILDEAYEYNKLLASTDPNIFSSQHNDTIMNMMKNGGLPTFFSYGRLIGTIDIPKIDIRLPLRSGTDQDILEQNAGFMINTSLPVGGESTHSVITAHRGLPTSRLFTDIDQLKIGDVFYVQVLDKPHAYEVDQIKIIEPTDVSELKIVEGQDYITLLTCHPYMINSHRLIVRGHRIPYTPQLEQKVNQIKQDNLLNILFIKYREYIIGIAIFLLLLLINHIRVRRIKKHIEMGDYDS